MRTLAIIQADTVTSLISWDTDNDAATAAFVARAFGPAALYVDVTGIPEVCVGAACHAGQIVQQAAPTLNEARAVKLAAVLAGANRLKAALSARYSQLEENTWPEQEAGARSITGTATACQNPAALLILDNPAALATAVELVNGLAAADGTEPKAFAARIVANADAARQAGTLSLLEQRSMESAVRNAATAQEIAAVPVRYSVLAQLARSTNKVQS